ncbi:ATP-binding protein [Parabacteroides sp. AF17-28]|uniref:ATP-binding protein n=1 Tax=Parabacteroides sp. AF17-28 TaxID=2292241 RepID=UPI000EFE2AA8|nr:ATP-binding protein [Parabacteroides sp. AF17-28]RHR58191.1 ATP-binding protein [Parabacteroides sp. AF17-28]
MELYRSIIEELKGWKSRPDRKPLVLKGARQTGKTWILEHFGRTEFEHVASFNFDKDESLYEIFENTKVPERIIAQLKLHTDSPILPHKTLIIFDEIQECNKALNALKYFCEDAPEYAVVAAGSLLGVALSKGDSFPVGKVEFMELYPLTFKEFLKVNDEKIYQYIEELSDIVPLPQIVTDKLTEFYRQYLVIGGMPAAVKAFMENKGMEAVKREQKFILDAYALDFSKHAESKDIPRITSIWNSIPSQLAKENRKFVYKMVKPGARARDYEDALLWLENAGLIYRIFCCTKPYLPLKSYDDLSAFKIYISDIGLLRELAGLPPEAVLAGSAIYTEFKGALAENYILQSLVCQLEVLPRYWTSIGKAEVDFVVQLDMNIIPVEVKSDTRIGGKSLSVYDSIYHPAYKIRYSLNNLKKDDNLINIPLYLADWTIKLVALQ